MNANNLMKYLAGAFLYGLWASLVFTGHADPLPLVAAIGAGISALLGYHAVTNLQAVAPTSILPPLPTLPLDAGK
ncbi:MULTISPECIES: hypothetical protein [Paraburkholderia]|uniref:hypothetical protein n=1 Tax=Paraburkholderia TaxID=1822464 RepID=UPI002258A1C0|nr:MULTISPECIES: hypothetical protein [Paraburkholderia]MCX4155008.1 hypothetical protein [Paraburkholderia aspalathi]MDN7164418.1 hypothetical protein [Paraburkholderia sp. SECH2]MDQ6392903.1 hypothetical protein [Paraburkholderia aspalathi]